MRDKADLTDKAERLEHIILQLQGETDTIGKSTVVWFTTNNIILAFLKPILCMDRFPYTILNFPRWAQSD